MAKYLISVQVVGMGGASFTVDSLSHVALQAATSEALVQAIKAARSFEKDGASRHDDTWRPQAPV